MREYSESFKRKIVQRLLAPGGPTAVALSAETGVHQTTLSRWLRDARSLAPMSDDARRSAPPPPVAARRPEDWTPEQKLRAVTEAAALSERELGEFLRREGLHEAQLAEWRKAALEALGGPAKPGHGSAPSRRVRELERQLRRKDKALAEAAAILVLQKKGPGHLGGRGRRHGPGDRQVTLELIDEAVRGGATLAAACRALGLSARTVARWRAEAGGEDGRAGPRHAPVHKLTEAERRCIVETANSPEFRNLSPKQIVPRLADRGVYLASESSFYRVLREQGLLAHRNPARPASAHRPRELVARRPNQVWCWDITYLKSAVRGAFYFLYLIVDVYSRKIVGWSVEAEESMLAASRLVEQTCERESVGSGCLVLHADNGGPMKGSTMLATLQRLGVVPSFSRPRVSDDNPYAEALFRTLKYRPEYPRRPFATVEQARHWVERFVAWYNGEHLHSSIRFVTPDDRHRGRDGALLAARHALYQRARRRTPLRWTGQTRNWTPIGPVTLNPHSHEAQALTRM
ncbi:IS3 family transposase [Sorangium cellulosum]|uniref:IS3 family transposase n=1 Tax=Sorangium cellulosum TaxID=56 RepID=UPI003D9A7CF9